MAAHAPFACQPVHLIAHSLGQLSLVHDRLGLPCIALKQEQQRQVSQNLAVGRCKFGSLTQRQARAGEIARLRSGKAQVVEVFRIRGT
jgi:hypothetical protein